MKRISRFFMVLIVFTLSLWFSTDAFAQASKELTNSIGMKLALIPKGTFKMGSFQKEEGRDEDEVRHEVTLSNDFFLGVTEVTQKQYQEVMGKNPSKFVGAQRPVEMVSWEDAVEFCERLSELPEEKKAGRVYRLPTEAEWEYACRAGSKTAFSFGDESGSLGDFAWFKDNSDGKTQSVGEKKPNAWGLYDMHGNVWEWCSDWYGEYPGKAVSDPAGPEKGSFRVIRGGSWDFVAAFCRSAFRDWNDPSYRYYYYGFRVALSSPGIPK
jgi:formylglycine-generating enzyme required for sulfatase activity